MLNYIWLALILLAVLIGGFDNKLKEVADGAVKGAESAVTLSLGLIGVMTVWLGLMRLAEKAGLVQALARFLQPVLRRLFPDVPVEHPAMGSMVLNIAANMLGLVNAATPLGLRAMRDLETLNKFPGTATNAMCTFLAINLVYARRRGGVPADQGGPAQGLAVDEQVEQRRDRHGRHARPGRRLDRRILQPSSPPRCWRRLARLPRVWWR